ncbi:MAG: hypothetical protein AB7F65_03455 [Dehalococcoidia bacterium]
MIPSWVRWVEVAQFLDGAQATDLQDWFAERGIYARIRVHRSHQPGVGTSVGSDLIPDRAPVASRFTVEVRRGDLEEARDALMASGWELQGYEGRWWISQTLTLVGMALTAAIVVALIVLLRVLGEG